MLFINLFLLANKLASKFFALSLSIALEWENANKMGKLDKVVLWDPCLIDML